MSFPIQSHPTRTSMKAPYCETKREEKMFSWTNYANKPHIHFSLGNQFTLYSIKFSYEKLSVKKQELLCLDSLLMFRSWTQFLSREYCNTNVFFVSETGWISRPNIDTYYMFYSAEFHIVPEGNEIIATITAGSILVWKQNYSVVNCRTGIQHNSRHFQRFMWKITSLFVILCVVTTCSFEGCYQLLRAKASHYFPAKTIAIMSYEMSAVTYRTVDLQRHNRKDHSRTVCWHKSLISWQHHFWPQLTKSIMPF
jgi:hypothetical protein